MRRPGAPWQDSAQTSTHAAQAQAGTTQALPCCSRQGQSEAAQEKEEKVPDKISSQTKLATRMNARQ